MIELTVDPTILITERTEEKVVYQAINGERWVIYGTCNCCGECEVGSDNPDLIWQGEIGQPFACIDSTYPNRLDVPVRPEIAQKMKSCVLRGEYL